MVRLVYYLDVLSSWCWYAEPAVARLRQTFGTDLNYEWRISWINDGAPLHYTRELLAWYYRRSGSISGTALNAAHLESTADSTRWPNLAAQAARELSCTGDEVRRALSRAAMIEGKHIESRELAIAVACEAGRLDPAALGAAMDDPATENRLHEWFAEFTALGATQRPTFTLRNDIGDAYMLSGNFRFEPLEACVRAMLEDEAGYRRFETANEPPPVD